MSSIHESPATADATEPEKSAATPDLPPTSSEVNVDAAASVTPITADEIHLAQMGPSSVASRSVSPPTSRDQSDGVTRLLKEKPSLLDYFVRRKLQHEPATVPARLPSKEEQVGLGSKLTFHWIASLLRLGNSRPLQLADVWYIPQERQVRESASRVQILFDRRKFLNQNNALFWALHDAFRWDFWVGGILLLCSSLLVVAAPYTLRYMISFATRSYVAGIEGAPEPPLGEGIGYVVGITLMLVTQSLLSNHASYRGTVVGGGACSVLSSLIFEKSLKLSAQAKADVANDEKRETTSNDSDAQKQHHSASSAGPGGWNEARIFTLTSNDTARIARVSVGIHSIWTGPVIICATTALLIANIGYSALPGFGILVLSVPGLGAMVLSLLMRRKAIIKITDKRIALLYEVLGAIRFVKLFGLENALFARIADLRSFEVKCTQKLLAVRNVVAVISISLPIFASMLSFVTYALTGHKLAAASAFSSVALFNVLRLPLASLPTTIYQAVDAWAALKRIEAFLNADELDEAAAGKQADRRQDPSAPALHMSDASFAWEARSAGTLKDNLDPSSGAATESSGRQQQQAIEAISEAQKPTEETEKTGTVEEETKASFRIERTNLTLLRGELVAVIGSIGSGKSSLLSAMAGEMIKLGGTMDWTTPKSYCSQRAWIWSASVRDNILFGKDMDEGWYLQVLGACCLQLDLMSLPNNDATIIGEKGVTLSGGQKQRIGLARALYANRDAVLLDDILSAVDAHVGKHLFENAICGLLKDKLRVLVTHNLEILPRCDRIIWVENGSIRAIDTFDNLMDQDLSFAKLITEQSHQKSTAKTAHRGIDNSASKTAAEMPANNVKNEVADIPEDIGKPIAWRIYIDYLAACGSLLHSLNATILLIIAQGASTASILWLSWWIRNKFFLELGVYVAIYAGLSVGQAMLFYLFAFVMTWVATTSNKNLFDRALTSVLRTKLAFFDTTPLGQVITRFSTDMDEMDDELMDCIRLFLVSFAAMVATFIVIICYLHWFGVALAAVLLMWVVMTRYFRIPTRSLENCEAALQARVLGRFSETLSGVQTLRVYDAQHVFRQNVNEAFDDYNSARILAFAAQKWYSIRLDTLGNVLFAVTGALVLRERFTSPPATHGLVMAFALGISGTIQFVMKNFSALEKTMNSVRRVHEYATTLQAEEELSEETCRRPAESWPSSGEVKFENVSMRYRPTLPLILKDFNLHIQSGERVGFVGRTGAGKSSIINTLFRLNQLTKGAIFIDGQDISQLRRIDLRSKLSIVPQDPTLFLGSVRSNLDPFDQYTDLVLWSALHKVGLASAKLPQMPLPVHLGRDSGSIEKVNHSTDSANTTSTYLPSPASSYRAKRMSTSESLEAIELSEQHARGSSTSGSTEFERSLHLDDPVTESGANFSVGQRQLLALARAIVRDSRIVICDEVTSSVDAATDAAIQRMMLDAFRGKTVICIAHRLRTVLNYDRICVMDQGRIVEIGKPSQLFSDGVGAFRELCEESGIDAGDFE